MTDEELRRGFGEFAERCAYKDSRVQNSDLPLLDAVLVRLTSLSQSVPSGVADELHRLLEKRPCLHCCTEESPCDKCRALAAYEQSTKESEDERR